LNKKEEYIKASCCKKVSFFFKRKEQPRIERKGCSEKKQAMDHRITRNDQISMVKEVKGYGAAHHEYTGDIKKTCFIKNYSNDANNAGSQGVECQGRIIFQTQGFEEHSYDEHRPGDSVADS